MIKLLKSLLEKSGITRNTTPKIIAALAAFVLWLYVMSEVNPETTTVITDVPVVLENVEYLRDNGLVIVGQESFTVSAKVTGRRNEVFSITKNDIKVTADLMGFQQGLNSVPLEVKPPNNLSNVEISPQQIKVNLDKIVTSPKVVEIVPQGNLASGYEIGSITTSPKQVIVEGPESRVKSVEKVIGEVNVEGQNNNIKGNIPIIPIDSEGRVVSGVEVKTKYVNVTIPVLKVRTVKVVPQIIGTVKEGYKLTGIDVNPSLVSLLGREDLVNQYNEVSTELIDITDKDRTLKVEGKLILPNGITTKQEKSPEITINIEKIETKEFTFEANAVSIKNLNETLTTNIGELDTKIKVNIVDVGSVLRNINRSDIELSVDGSNLGEGQHTVNLIVTLNSEVQTVEVTPSILEINVFKKNRESRQEGTNEAHPGERNTEGN